MTDRELNLHKRNKTALINSIEKNVFGVVDKALKEKDEASAADDLMDLTGLLKTIDDSVVELKGYNNKIYELIAEDAEVEKEMDDDMTLKMKISIY